MIPVIQSKIAGMEGLAVSLYFTRTESSAVPLDRNRLHVGSVEFCRQALGDKEPPPLDYPQELYGFLLREIRFEFGKPKLFIKPFRTKAFEPYVQEQTRQINEHYWASEVVEFGAEYRCYFLNQKLAGIARYDAIECQDLEPAEVEAFANQLNRAWKNDKPVSFALDVGTIGGKLALVEATDAWAIGLYSGMSRDLYAQMLATRWAQMVGV